MWRERGDGGEGGMNMYESNEKERRLRHKERRADRTMAELNDCTLSFQIAASVVSL